MKCELCQELVVHIDDFNPFPNLCCGMILCVRCRQECSQTSRCPNEKCRTFNTDVTNKALEDLERRLARETCLRKECSWMYYNLGTFYMHEHPSKKSYKLLKTALKLGHPLALHRLGKWHRVQAARRNKKKNKEKGKKKFWFSLFFCFFSHQFFFHFSPCCSNSIDVFP